MAGRNSQISRIYALFDILEGSTSGYTVSELHQKAADRGHEASKRTIYRDLEALAKAGFPLFPEGDDESSQRWRLERKAKVNQYFMLSARELFALYLARGALTPLRETPFYQDLQSIFQKLEEKFGTKQAEYFSSLEQELKFEAGPAWGLGVNPEVLETIRAACSEGHQLECTYYSVNSKSETKRTLGPHYLYYSLGGLYLVAEDLADKKVKVFALPRFKNAAMLSDSYDGIITTPEDFFESSMNVFQGKEVEEIVIEFAHDVAHFVKERKWHSSQRVTNLENGKIRVQLEVSQTPELISWILGFGPNAKVKSPDSLAERIAISAMKIAKQYKTKVS